MYVYMYVMCIAFRGYFVDKVIFHILWCQSVSIKIHSLLDSVTLVHFQNKSWVMLLKVMYLTKGIITFLFSAFMQVITLYIYCSRVIK